MIDTFSGPRSVLFFEASDLVADLSELRDAEDDFDDWFEDSGVPEELINDPEFGLELLAKLKYESKLLDVGLFGGFFFFFFR